MKKVLIIDDHATTRDLVKWALSESGLKLHEASNGDTGLQLARQLQPDLIKPFKPATLRGVVDKLLAT